MTAATRERLVLVLALLAVVPAGLWLRSHGGPDWLRNGSGAVLYEVLWIIAAGLVWPRAPSWQLATVVLAATCAVELLQLCDAAWLTAVRDTRPGRLLLGGNGGFDPADFPLYALGSALGGALLALARRFSRTSPAKALSSR